MCSMFFWTKPLAAWGQVLPTCEEDIELQDLLEKAKSLCNPRHVPENLRAPKQISGRCKNFWSAQKCKRRTRCSNNLAEPSLREACTGWKDFPCLMLRLALVPWLQRRVDKMLDGEAPWICFHPWTSFLKNLCPGTGEWNEETLTLTLTVWRDFFFKNDLTGRSLASALYGASFKYLIKFKDSFQIGLETKTKSTWKKQLRQLIALHIQDLEFGGRFSFQGTSVDQDETLSEADITPSSSSRLFKPLATAFGLISPLD